MKRYLYMAMAGLLLCSLGACGQGKSENMQSMNRIETEEGNFITWNGKKYVDYGVIDNDERGKQIGIVNGDKKDQIYEVKGHSTDQWLISFYHSGEMDNSILMKEEAVTEIPKDLQSVSEFE